MQCLKEFVHKWITAKNKLLKDYQKEKFWNNKGMWIRFLVLKFLQGQNLLKEAKIFVSYFTQIQFEENRKDSLLNQIINSFL